MGAMHDVCNAREHGLVGNGTTNDQPALAALVERLGREFQRDRRPRVIYCPPGEYLIADEVTVWRSGVSLIGASAGATRFVLANPGSGKPVPLPDMSLPNIGGLWFARLNRLWHGKRA